MYGCKANSLFALKALMKKNPLTTNFSILFAIIIIFAQALRVAEAPLSRLSKEMNHYNYFNSIWDVILCITTSKPHKFEF